MAIARSRITAQGQISIPLEIRRKLSVGPGSILEWQEESGKILIRRVGRFTSENIHTAAFRTGVPKPKTLDKLKAGIKGHIRNRARMSLLSATSWENC